MAATFNLANQLELELLHEARNGVDDTAYATAARPHAQVRAVSDRRPDATTVASRDVDLAEPVRQGREEAMES